VIPLNTARTAGTTQDLHLTLGALPAGVTGSFDAAALAAGDTTNLRLSASASAADTRDAVVVVTACAGAGTCPSPGVPAHTASLLLQVSRRLPGVRLSVAAAASGTVPISASATPGQGTALASLSISVDGHPVATSATPSLVASWDTTEVPNGEHVVTATATDDDGVSSSIEERVAVTNDFTLAIVPGRGDATIGGSPATFTVSTEAIGGREPVALAVSGLPAGVQASFDQASGPAGSSATLTVVAPAGVALGRATFTVAATTRSVPAGHQVSADVTIIHAPSATIAAPVGGAISGKVTISVTATVDPNAGLVRIDVKQDDTVVATGTTATLSVPWDTTRVRNGAHALSAVVVDGAGNLGEAPPVSLVVLNSSGCSSSGTSGLEGLGPFALLAAIRRRRRRPSPSPAT
jgi:uncharacterized protein (TIGR03382 family)